MAAALVRLHRVHLSLAASASLLPRLPTAPPDACPAPPNPNTHTLLRTPLSERACPCTLTSAASLSRAQPPFVWRGRAPDRLSQSTPLQRKGPSSPSATWQADSPGAKPHAAPGSQMKSLIARPHVASAWKAPVVFTGVAPIPRIVSCLVPGQRAAFTRPALKHPCALGPLSQIKFLSAEFSQGRPNRRLFSTLPSDGTTTAHTESESATGAADLPQAAPAPPHPPSAPHHGGTNGAPSSPASAGTVKEFRQRLRIADVISGERAPDDESWVGETVRLTGWVRTVRDQKTFAFVELNDGSCLTGIQVVAQPDVSGYEGIGSGDITTGAAIAVEGEVVESQGKGQKLEIVASRLELVGGSDSASYPLQKKRHSLEFLRSIAHLRPRTNTIGAVSRVRNVLYHATHRFFQDNGFLWVASPVITASDCEGAGEQFCVTTLVPDSARDPTATPAASIAKTKEGAIDWSRDFFKKPAFLTVSGQLNAEIYSSAFHDVYTFGPTFRAEKSNTSRHLAEFWMVEPEVAFADLSDDMACAAAYLKYILREVLEACADDYKFLEKFVEPGITERLIHVLDQDFKHVTYTEAVECLLKSKEDFEFPVKWGIDLQSEHERFLTERVFKGPVIVTDYPKDIKAFYMRANDDGATVAAMDVLVPRVGELMGGSQREERLDVLERRMGELGLSTEAYWWYLDLRRYGSVPHAGFGVGFERLVQYVTGVENIRDAIPFPRAPGSADF